MSEGDTLAKALADVRRRMAVVQAEHERLTVELTKLRVAENSLAAIVEGAPLADTMAEYSVAEPAGSADVLPRSGRGGGRGSRGPRANSAKGRLKALLDGAGPQGLSHAEIARRLSDVAPNTLSTYLSVMANSGEALRRGDFYTAGVAAPASDEGPEDDTDADTDPQRSDEGDEEAEAAE